MRAERRGGELVDLGERGEQPVLVEVGRGERQREVVAVAEPARGPVAQAGELAHVGGDLGADASSTPPTRPAAARCRRSCAAPRGSSLSSTGCAVDRAAVACEARLDVASAARRSRRRRSGVDLVGREASARAPSSWRATSGSVRARRLRAADRGERVGVGERVGERDVGLGASALGLVAGVDVGVPPRARCAAVSSGSSVGSRDELGDARRRRSLEPDALVVAAHRVQQQHDEQHVEREPDQRPEVPSTSSRRTRRAERRPATTAAATASA